MSSGKTHGVRFRRFMIGWPCLLLFVLAAGFPARASSQQAGSVSGRVTSEATGSPLAGATVELVNSDGSRAVVTDAHGRYSLSSVPPGRATIRVRHIGHDPFEFEALIAAGREITVDLSLALRPLTLEPVHVDGSQLRAVMDTIAVPEAELGPATARVMESAPALGEVGLADAGRGIRGEPHEPGSVLFVRGAASDLKLVHLDGAPVYAPFPLGGLLEPFTPELLAAANIYLGGAPARYDGGLSYVMDLRTRAPGNDGFQTSGSADLLSAGVVAEIGDGGRYGALASVRGMHPLGSTDLFGAGIPYDYSEGIVRGDLRLGENATLSLTGFTNDESVLVTGREGGSRTIDWGNRAGSVRLNAWVAETDAEITASIGHYEATLPFGGGETPLLAKGTADRFRFSADLARNAGDLAIRYGGSVEEQAFSARSADPAAPRIPTYSMDAKGRVIGGYAEVSFELLPRVRVRGGARVDRFSSGGQIEAAPRFSATWLMTDRAAITVAGGVYHQFLKAPEEVLVTAASPSDLRYHGPLLVGSASHVTATLDQDFGDGMRFGMEGFYKRFSNLPSVSSPEANASGVDLWVRRTSEGASGWFGYSLAWVWSAGGEQPARSDFTGRHLLSTGLEIPLGDRTELEFRFGYGAGLPYAGIPLETKLQSGSIAELSSTASLRAAERGGTESAPLLFTPDEPYIRIDAALSRRWTSRPGGRAMDVVPFLRVINALGNREGLFYYLDKAGGDSRPTPVGGLPLVPILGVEWRY